MFLKKSFVITIGNYGAVITLHNGDKIENKIFLEELNEKVKSELIKLFSKNKTIPVYSLLDTIDQTYRKKNYPTIKRSDLKALIERDIESDIEKDSLKNYIILDNHRNKVNKTNRSECLFISLSPSEFIDNWINFLVEEIPNHFKGIYMLPVETFDLIKIFNKKNEKKAEKLNQDKLYCLVLQNKVSGTRQIVFSDQGIVFTRVVNYDFTNAEFVEKYEQDIYGTFEYLKRLLVNLDISELTVINILPNVAIEAVKKINNIELSFINYTPYQFTSEIGYKNIISENSDFCDLLISKAFAKSKKILKFSTPKTKKAEYFLLTLFSSYYLNLFLSTIICCLMMFGLFIDNDSEEVKMIAETKKLYAMQELTRSNDLVISKEELTYHGEVEDIERVIDFGKIHESISQNEIDFASFYSDLSFLKDCGVIINKIDYSLQNFNSKSPNQKLTYKADFSGKLINASGDVDDLFKEFDNLNSKTKQFLEKEGVSIKYSDLPKNISFSEKYYEADINFTITKN
jgi:hypothetical protein